MRCPYGNCINCGEASADCLCSENEPVDEDLVTKDRLIFYRFGMNRVAFVVPKGEDWQGYATKYMDKRQYWPDVWLEEERGGYINITTEQE